MRLSITAKINFFLLFIFSMVLVFSAAYQAVRERDLILTLIKEQSREQSVAYFDGLNMLMLTGKMDARDTRSPSSPVRSESQRPLRLPRSSFTR